MNSQLGAPSRTERPSIRPFAGMEPMEELIEQVRLQCDGLTGPVAEDETLYLDTDSLQNGVFRLVIPWDEIAVAAAVESAGVPLESLDVVAIADPKLIGPRTVLMRRPLKEFATTQSALIAGHDGQRSESTIRPKNGFDIQIAVILNRPNEGSAVQPRQLGSILAESTFRVRREAGIGSLVFYPLDDKKKKDEGLPKDSLIFLERQAQSLLEAVDFDSAVRVYVDDRLLGILERDRSLLGELSQRVILGQLLVQLLAMGSSELQIIDEVENIDLTGDDGSTVIAFGRLLKGIAKAAKLGRPKEFEGSEEIHGWLHLLKHQPQLFFTAASSQAGLQSEITRLLAGGEAI